MAASQRTSLYYIWQEIVDCTRNPRYKRYPAYGGRGIELYPVWCSYTAFQIWALGAGCQKGYCLTCLDPDGNFTPSNCSWIPFVAQKPRKRGKLYSAFGETKSLCDWADDPRVSVSSDTISGRLKSGWEIERALSTPPMKGILPVIMLAAFGETKSVRAWARDPRISVSHETIYKRLKSGWDIEMTLSTPPMPSSFFKEMLTAFGETKSLSAWGHDSRVSVSCYLIYGRLKSGWEIEKALITPSIKAKRTSTD